MKRITVVAVAAISLTSSYAAASAASLYDLRTESLVNPLGIDAPKPRFSWKMKDDRQGASQQAWEIQIASTTETLLSGKPDVWDSGLQSTSASTGLVYAGPALKPRTSYIWHARIWDKDGQASDYSEPAVWETGMMSAAQDAWKGKWISSAYETPAAKPDFSDVTWIWYPSKNISKAPAGTRYFRYHFELPQSPVVSAKAWVLADNEATVYINGKKAQFVSGFKGIQLTDVTQYFKPGVNVVQVSAINQTTSPAALAWCADLKFKNGKTKRINTDISWRTSIEAGKDWPVEGTGKGDWIGVKDVGNIGSEPWGKPNVEAIGPPATVHRKQFKTKAGLTRARLYITALGSYRAEINGQRVGNDILTPDWTDYRHRVMYQTYDVTPLVKNGDNALGVTLGDGWYASALGWGLERLNFGPAPTRLLAELHLSYADGSEDVIPSDKTWKTTGSPIVRSEIYFGETYDARLEKAGWSTAGFNDTAWDAEKETATSATIEVNAQASPPIRVAQEVEPVAITEPTSGTFVFDMGQNMVGWARLKVSGKAGDTVRLRFVEILNPDGTVYRENLRRAEATDTYTLKGGGEETFEPHFTYHGFRYVEVTGYPGKPTNDAIVGRVFHTDAPFVGKFESSDATVNKVAENTRWGLKGNLMSVPTDCPQRDERLGWTGDAEAIWKTACYLLDMQSFTDKWMRDMRDAQSEKGDYPNVAPRVISIETGAPAWGDAGVIIPYQAWLMYGDTHLLSEMWDSMEAWMGFIAAENPDYLWMKRRGNDFGDWVPADSKTDKDLIATAYWAGDAMKMRDMAAALGKKDKVQEYEALYGKIRKAFQDKFIKPDGTIANGSQTCYILALDNNLVQDELVEKAVSHLVDDIKARENHLSTGFLGTTYIMPVLTEHGQLDTAITLLLNKTYPSWGYMVVKGATTIWERWNSDSGDPAMNSFNHYCYGALTDWLYGYLAGIRPVTPGFQTMLIEPHPEQRLKFVKVSYDSQFGLISSDWKYEGDNLGLNVTIPANTSAKISLPTADAGKVTVGGKSLADAGFKPVAEKGRVVIDAGAGKYDFTIVK